MKKIDRLSTLCAKGYFIKELPSVFTTKNFGDNIRDIIKDWAKNGSIPADYKKSKNEWKSLPYTEAESFSMPKTIHERRYLHLTHPISQAMLSYTISKNWVTISNWLSKSKYSFDKTIITNEASRAVPEPMFLKHQIHKEQIESCSVWIVKSDITRFYPSIYTHSITWSVYGKEKVKKKLSKYKGSLGDQLDILVRKCNRNQTVGIPIGPDTSRIIADLVSAYVDNEVLSVSSLSADNADRLQDDWLIGCNTLEEAENYLAKIRLKYQKLGLDINGSKTSILHLRDQKSPTWSGILRSSLNKKLTGNVLHDLCKTSLSLQAEYPNEKILNYLLAAFYNKNFKNSDLAIVEAFLLKAVIVNPKVTDVVCKLFLNYIYENKKISIEKIQKRFIPFVENALENGLDFEACWGLYLLRGLKIKLEIPKIIKLSKAYEGATIPLILFDMHSKGYIKSPNKAYWQKKILQSDYKDWTWLLAYEGVRNGWLKDQGNKVKKHPYLEPLFKRNIIFYDKAKNVPTRNAINKKRFSILRMRRKVLESYLAGY